MSHADPDSKGIFWLVALVVLGGGGWGGYRLWMSRVHGAQQATMTCSYRFDLQDPAAGMADCEATFHTYPKSGDPTDVQVTLTGPTLVQPMTYDWPYLAPQDKREGPALSPNDPPPLGRALRWRMPIPLVRSLRPGIGDFIVRAQLTWAGAKQDLARLNTKVQYAPQGGGF
jgi:hypothetical protein